jgi:hypothetical protein
MILFAKTLRRKFPDIFIAIHIFSMASYTFYFYYDDKYPFRKTIVTVLRSLSYRATSADETFLRFQRRNDNFPLFQGWQPL